MIIEQGKKFIGFFEWTPYADFSEHFDDYQCNNYKIDRSVVLDHLKSVYSHGFFTSEPTYDVESGERFPAGLCDDGDFTITTDFIRYYEQGKVDIPKEYEDYLISKLHIA